MQIRKFFCPELPAWLDRSLPLPLLIVVFLPFDSFKIYIHYKAQAQAEAKADEKWAWKAARENKIATKKTKPISNFKFQFISAESKFFFLDWLGHTPAAITHQSWGCWCCWWHATSRRAGGAASQRLVALINWQRTVATICMAVAAAPCGKLLLIAPASRALRSRAHYECNVLTDNSGRELLELVVQQVAGRQTVRQADCAANCAATFNWQLLARSATFPLSIYDDDRQTEAEGELQRERGWESISQVL